MKEYFSAASSGRLAGRLAAVSLCLVPLFAHAATVVEFYNTNLDNYFITANAVEAAAIDSGSAGPGWSRTGDTFNEGGLSPVCRFYGSITPGPNSHFYTVDTAECALLKQLQVTTPSTQKRWNFESLDFITTAPENGGCPAGTVSVYRAYNNGSSRGVDSNHRITTSPANIQEVVARGWVSEGVVMCGATAASVAAIAQFWQGVRGVWTFGAGSTPFVIRFQGSGGYLIGSTEGTAAGLEHPGLERGTLAYDALTARVSSIIAQDTNGTGGFSDRDAAEALNSFALEGGALVARDPGGGEAFRLQRVENNQGSIVGAWALGTADNISAQMFIFFADGRFMMVDPVGDTAEPGHASCGGAGVELGTYLWNGGNGTLTITGVSIDTNGCAGLNDALATPNLFEGVHSIPGIVIANGGNTLTAGDTVLRRLSQ